MDYHFKIISIMPKTKTNEMTTEIEELKKKIEELTDERDSLMAEMDEMEKDKDRDIEAGISLAIDKLKEEYDFVKKALELGFCFSVSMKLYDRLGGVFFSAIHILWNR